MNINEKDHAEQGVHFLTANTTSPAGEYYGFVVTGDATVISAITYKNPALITGDIVDITLIQGLYIPVGITSITIISGNLILYKKSQ